MFKTEHFQKWPMDLVFADALRGVDEQIREEFSLKYSDHRCRQSDNTFAVSVDDNRKYICDTQEEFFNVIAKNPSVQGFYAFFAYTGSKTMKKSLSSVSDHEHYGVGIEYSMREIKVSANSDGDYAFIERAIGIMAETLHLERITRLDEDGYRRKMLNPTAFIGRHFDSSGNQYYSSLNDFLRLLGFEVIQGEEYVATGIPEKVRHRIDGQDISVIIFSGNRSHDWLVSEAAYAHGKGKHVIVLVESDIQIDLGIMGSDLEYISFPSGNVEKSFLSLMREFRSIGIKGVFS